MAHSRNFLSLVYLRVICPILRMRQPLVSTRRNFYIELDRKTQKFRRKSDFKEYIWSICLLIFLKTCRTRYFKQLMASKISIGLPQNRKTRCEGRSFCNCKKNASNRLTYKTLKTSESA